MYSVALLTGVLFNFQVIVPILKLLKNGMLKFSVKNLNTISGSLMDSNILIDEQYSVLFTCDIKISKILQNNSKSLTKMLINIYLKLCRGCTLSKYRN